MISWLDRWSSFKKEEVLSPIGLRYFDRGELLIQPHALDFLQAFRDHLQKEFLINHLGLQYRGYRHPEENRKVGGTFASSHMQGLAFDVTVKGMTPKEVGEAAKVFGWKGIGVYEKRGFTHLDLRTRLNGGFALWDEG